MIQSKPMGYSSTSVVPHNGERVETELTPAVSFSPTRCSMYDSHQLDHVSRHLAFRVFHM